MVSLLLLRHNKLKFARVRTVVRSCVSFYDSSKQDFTVTPDMYNMM